MSYDIPTQMNVALRAALEITDDAGVEVIDESHLHAGHAGMAGREAKHTHFRVRVISPLFVGKSRVMRERMVTAALKPFIEGGVHALAITALVAGE